MRSTSTVHHPLDGHQSPSSGIDDARAVLTQSSQDRTVAGMGLPMVADALGFIEVVTEERPPLGGTQQGSTPAACANRAWRSLSDAVSSIKDR